MKKFLYIYTLFILFFLLGCASNIKNISTDISSRESLIVGRIETIPEFWSFSLYEEHSRTKDQINIKGEGFGLTKAGKLQNGGYIFKIIRPGVYVLRMRKVTAERYSYEKILQFEVPEGRLVYFGTIKIVIDRAGYPPDESEIEERTSPAFIYHFEYIDEYKTLKYFEEQYPEVYSSYKDNIIIRIPSRTHRSTVAFLMDE